jgi:phage baseplate assembly protein V
MREQLERLWRRLQLVIGRGRIRVIDDSTPAQTLQVQLGADETKDGLPRVAEYGFTSNPPPGTDAVVIFLAGERTNGVVVGTNNQQFRLRNLATGEVALYDNRGRFVLLSEAGIHVQGNADPILAETTSTITAHAGGDINATSDGGAVNATAATSIKLEAPFIHLKGSSIVLDAPGVGIEATTLTVTAETNVTGATSITGTTALIGDTSVTGAMTNNGHDIGQGHKHLPGTLKANTTNVTGVSGGVTP